MKWRSMSKVSGIDEHQRRDKKLIAPLNQLPIQPVNWHRDVLPEYLWIEFLKQSHPSSIFLELYSELCNTLRSYSEGNLAFIGFISDFGRIPQAKQEEIKSKHLDLIVSAFAQPFGKIVDLYPNSPCYWLLPQDWLKNHSGSRSESIAGLSTTLERLYPSKESYCAYLRMIPLRRLLEEGKIFFTKKFEELELLPRYPEGLSEADRERCESFGRALLGGVLPNYVDPKWAKYFWRRNFELSPCKIYKRPISFQKILSQDFSSKLEVICKSNVKLLTEYIEAVRSNYKFDLYTPENDEVVLGLFSRIIRLASLINENSFLWSFDLGRILLRCLSDTVITFCYLILKNDDVLFASFVEYGRGKEKLLLLHLQDTHPKEVAPSGETPDILLDQLGGGMSPAFIDINLGDWKDVSARDMAKTCGLLDIYRLIYDPTSSDIHGTWTSIKNVNLTYCANPLHRLHRVPQVEQPPFFLQPLEVTTTLVERAINFAQKHWSFPTMKGELMRLPADE